MAMAEQTKTSLSGLPRRFALDKLLSEADAKTHAQKARQSGQSFVTQVVDAGLVSESDAAMVAAREFGIPLFDLDALEQHTFPQERFDAEIAEQYHACVVHENSGKLYVAIADPTNLVALDQFKHKYSLPTEAVLVESNKLSGLIHAASSNSYSFSGDLEEADDGQADDEVLTESKEDDTPIVRFVNKVLLDAINRGASDIHVEPYEKSFRIRYRIDGILKEVAQAPVSTSGKVVARLKVMSKMDISERRVPQDGRIKINVKKNKAIDFRVNTCPTLFGEKVVLRILDASAATLGIDMLGYEPEQKAAYLKALANPYGMILVTGPTGSGKTVSLYTGLNILNTPETNISTAEDPAEINLPGINQVNVNAKVGLTFSEALKSFLRQDPDVIMVGEIRDLDTASIAIKAAQTGHLVLSTLHTNDAPQTLTRLLNMGVPAFNIASAVSLIIAQRLARRLCEHCKQPIEVPQETLLQEGFTQEQLSDLTVYGAVGCNKCSDGFKGRVGIYQVMPISENMERIIMQSGNAQDIADQAAKEGIQNLRQSALLKVTQGVISLEEANRVTRD